MVSLLLDAAARRLTPAGAVVFAVVPTVLAGVYLYLFWCLLKGRIGTGARSGARWILRKDSPREFWLRWWWSFGLLTVMTILLVGGLSRAYFSMRSA